MSLSEIKDSMPSDYKLWLSALKQSIRYTQLRATIKANSELIHLYWHLGADINEKQLESAWGKGFFKQLSRDLKSEFPDMKGFSETNLKYIKRFYLFYHQSTSIRQQAADELPEAFFQTPWFHHVEIITKCKTYDEALFYVYKTVENGWSRSVLVHHLQSKLYDRSGKAITNFHSTLPTAQSDLAQQITKDPYVFDLLDFTEKHNERELENHLATHMTQFLLELGAGFTYYGRQVNLKINGDDFYIDLLFYHLKLRCFVVVELKTTKFMPEHVGQLKFYVTAIDREMRTEHDNPTIGILICKDKNSVVAEYALQNIASPIGVSSYEVFKQLTDEYKGTLPTIEEIERGLNEK